MLEFLFYAAFASVAAIFVIRGLLVIFSIVFIAVYPRLFFRR